MTKSSRRTTTEFHKSNKRLIKRAASPSENLRFISTRVSLLLETRNPRSNYSASLPIHRTKRYYSKKETNRKPKREKKNQKKSLKLGNNISVNLLTSLLNRITRVSELTKRNQNRKRSFRKNSYTRNKLRHWLIKTLINQHMCTSWMSQSMFQLLVRLSQLISMSEITKKLR